MSDSGHGPHVNYFFIFGLLCVFTGMSVVTDLVEIPNKFALIVIVLAIAVAKASCVMMFFMHLKFEGNWKFIILAPTTILAIGLPIALLPDVGFHYYIHDASQIQHETVEESEHEAAHTPRDH